MVLNCLMSLCSWWWRASFITTGLEKRGFSLKIFVSVTPAHMHININTIKILLHPQSIQSMFSLLAILLLLLIGNTIQAYENDALVGTRQTKIPGLNPNVGTYVVFSHNPRNSNTLTQTHSHSLKHRVHWVHDVRRRGVRGWILLQTLRCVGVTEFQM